MRSIPTGIFCHDRQAWRKKSSTSQTRLHEVNVCCKWFFFVSSHDSLGRFLVILILPGKVYLLPTFSTILAKQILLDDERYQINQEALFEWLFECLSRNYFCVKQCCLLHNRFLVIFFLLSFGSLQVMQDVFDDAKVFGRRHSFTRVGISYLEEPEKRLFGLHCCFCCDAGFVIHCWLFSRREVMFFCMTLLRRRPKKWEYEGDSHIRLTWIPSPESGSPTGKTHSFITFLRILRSFVFPFPKTVK